MPMAKRRGETKRALTFADLSKVEVEPTDEEVGVLYLLRHCCLLPELLVRDASLYIARRRN